MTITLVTMKRLDKSRLETFDAHLFPDLLGVVLWVMEYMSEGDDSRFGSTKIANHIVNVLGISTSKQSVQSVLTRATTAKLCHKADGGFKLMKIGQDELLKQMNIDRVLLLRPGEPFRAGIELGKLLSQAEGPISVSDPYVDVNTLETLYEHFIGRDSEIRLLASQIKGLAEFNRSLRKIRAEKLNLEVRKISRDILHDRYLIDRNQFWLSGNSLNNLGNKESFIVMLDDGWLRQTMLRTFDTRWQESTVVTP